MITELTLAENDKLIDFGLKWSKIGLSTEPVVLQDAMEAIKKAYEFAGLNPPKAYLGPFNNPVDCAKAQIAVKRMPRSTKFDELTNLDIAAGEEFSAEELYAAIGEQQYGFHDSGWLCSYDFMKEVLELQELESLDGLMEVAKNVGWWAAYDKVAFFQDRPEEVHFNEDGELHNDNGPAIKWRGEDRSFDIYAINGEVQPPPA
jgi:hypothetical protein